VRLPSLRERPEDIRHLVRYYLNQLNQGYQRNVNIAPAAMKQLTHHAWPGNIRQLRNVLERLALLAEDSIITDAEVAMVLQSETQTQAMMPVGGGMMPQPHQAAYASPSQAQTVRAYNPVREDDRTTIEAALRDCNGNKSRAAQMLQMTLRQLNYRLKVLDIKNIR